MSAAERVASFVREQDVIRYARELVRVPCENPPGRYEEIQEYLRSAFSALGLKVEIVGKPGYPNILGRLPGEKDSPTFIIDGHIDTVPAGDPKDWTVDPFGGEMKEGKIFGRGAADQRGGIAAFIAAAKALVDSGEKLKGNLILLGHSDSETGGVHGQYWLVENHPEKVKADWGLGTEPMGFVIVTACRGTFWVEITTRGVSGHTAMFNDQANMKDKPINAVSKMVKILAAVEDVDSWMTFQPNELLGPKYGQYSTKPIVEVGGKIDLDGTGVKVNIVPHICRAQVDMRILPGQNPENVMRELEALITRLRAEDPEIDADVKPLKPLRLSEPYEVPESSPLIQALKAAATDVLGREPEVGGGLTIGGGARALGTLGMPVSAFGPRAFCIHSSDEYVLVEDLVKCAKVYANLYVRLLG